MSGAPALRDRPADRDMQPEAHRVHNAQNSREVWMLWTARKRTINARPLNPRSVRKVRDVVQTGGGANGAANFGDVRRLKRLIDAVRSSLAAVRLRSDRPSDGFFRHIPSNRIGRHFCRPSLLEKLEWDEVSIALRRNRRSGS